MYCIDPEYVQPLALPIFPVCSSCQDSLFYPEQIVCNIGSVEKNNLTAKKEKRFNLIQK